MQKLINEPARFATEVVDGVLAAYPDRLRRLDRGLAFYSAVRSEGNVAVVTGGGSGHLPLFMGYVGRGLLDGVAIGEVFASPSATLIANLARTVDAGAGVLFLYGNYGGDVMNFDMAADLLEEDGVATKTVLATDDVASAPAGSEARRRGIAGITLLFKIAGAAATEGRSLEDVAAVTGRAATGIRTMGVALSPTILPLRGEPTFELPDGLMEVGMGIHGEPGVAREPLQTAHAVGERLASTVLADLNPEAGSEFAVMINGLGSTPLEELFLVFKSVEQTIRNAGHSIWRAYVGEYATSLEMGGASVTLCAVDDELKILLLAPTDAPMLQPW